MADPYATRWLIKTATDNGFSDGDVVRIRGTGYEQIDNVHFAIHTLSTTVFALMDLAYAKDVSGTYQDDAYIANPDGNIVTTGEARLAVDEISGFLYLIGLTVAGVTDGDYFLGTAVTSDTLSLGGWYSDIILGLPYESILEPIGINATDTGSALAQVQRIRDISVRFKDTLGAKTTTDTLTYHTIAEAGVESSGGTITWRDVVFRNSSDVTSESPELFTGVMDIPIEQRHSKDPRVVLKQTAPMPFNVLGITYWFETTQNPEGSPNASSKTV